MSAILFQMAETGVHYLFNAQQLGFLLGKSAVHDPQKSIKANVDIAHQIGEPAVIHQYPDRQRGHSDCKHGLCCVSHVLILAQSLLRAQQVRKKPVRPGHAGRQLPEPRI